MIETITALLASATFIWSASIIAIIAMAILLENELEGWATTIFSLGLALLLWNFKMDIWSFIISNPTKTIGFILFYILAGVVWSFLKWHSYVKNIFLKIKEVKDNFIRENKEINEKNIRFFNDNLRSLKLKDADGYQFNIDTNATFDKILEKATPVASKKKSVITSWISYWPVSLAATLLNNPFRRFFEWIYTNLSGYYDKITNSQKQALLN